MNPSRQPVIVFDVDGVLCGNDVWKEVRAHPECPVIPFVFGDRVWGHWFIPHLEPLFSFLLSMNVRLVFFSSGREDRNITVLTELVDRLYGAERAQALRAAGQFEILSSPSLRPGRRDLGEAGNYIKDLTRVVRPGEDLADILLVEDQSSYAAHDQRPCLKAVDCECWMVQCADGEIWSYVKNGAYFLLSVLRTLLCDPPYAGLPLRSALAAMEVDREVRFPYRYGGEANDPFVLHHVACGVNLVRERYPEALLYGVKALDEKEADRGPSHDRVAIDRILRSVESGERRADEPTMQAFLTWVLSSSDAELIGRVQAIAGGG